MEVKLSSCLILFFTVTLASAEPETSSMNLNDQGVRSLESRNWSEAIEKLERALAKDPSNRVAMANLSIAHNNLAIYLMQHEDNLKASLLHFHQSVFLDPSNDNNRRNLDGFIRRLGKAPSSFADRVELGNSASDQGDNAGAIVEYKAALDIAFDRTIQKKLQEIVEKISPSTPRVAVRGKTISTVTAEKPTPRNPANSKTPKNVSHTAAIIGKQIPPLTELLSGSGGSNGTHILTTQQLEQGNNQVLQMIHDRPEMSQYVTCGDPIWNWCTRQFAGEVTGSSYLWRGNDTEPDGVPGWHRLPSLGKPGIITAGQTYSKPMSAEELWAIVIFELFNIRNDPEFAEWLRHEKFGSVTRTDRVKQFALKEFEAQKATSKFYTQYWLPRCKLLKLSSKEKYWFLDRPTSFEKWFNSIPKDSLYLKHYMNQ